MCQGKLSSHRDKVRLQTCQPTLMRQGEQAAKSDKLFAMEFNNELWGNWEFRLGGLSGLGCSL
jgi:hypothetical protein